MNYENSIALNQYESLQDGTQKTDTKEIILPRELNPKQVAKKKEIKEEISLDAQNLLALKLMQSSDRSSDSDKRQKDKYLVEPPKFDEA